MSKIFQEENPLNDNYVCIYQRVLTGKKLLFQIDKANFETDDEFETTVFFIVNALNKQL